MKVFRISGRDARLSTPTIAPLTRLNESLPHKRKRRLYSLRPATAVSKRLNESLPYKRKRLHIHCPNERRRYASMKVFRISGRDHPLLDICRVVGYSLNESLPHKRKRRQRCYGMGTNQRRLNESLPHKRKRQKYAVSKAATAARLNESLPHKRKRPAVAIACNTLLPLVPQ